MIRKSIYQPDKSQLISESETIILSPALVDLRNIFRTELSKIDELFMTVKMRPHNSQIIIGKVDFGIGKNIILYQEIHLGSCEDVTMVDSDLVWEIRSKNP